MTFRFCLTCDWGTIGHNKETGMMNGFRREFWMVLCLGCGNHTSSQVATDSDASEGLSDSIAALQAQIEAMADEMADLEAQIVELESVTEESAYSDADALAAIQNDDP